MESENALGEMLMGYLKFRKSLGQSRLTSLARRYWSDAVTIKKAVSAERSKSSSRTEIINYCIQRRNATSYLEIGVRNPDDNFNLITCANKLSVDPGFDFQPNPVDFPMTSDDFYSHWKIEIKVPYDVIFIDGLHRAEQVSRDIRHALEMTSSDGLVILHDCNPPHHELAREQYDESGVAGPFWNGTTWKATWEFFFNGPWESRVVDSDWGVGIIDKSKAKIPIAMRNPFFEFDEFSSIKDEVGYLVSWENAKDWLAQ